MHQVRRGARCVLLTSKNAPFLTLLSIYSGHINHLPAAMQLSTFSLRLGLSDSMCVHWLSNLAMSSLTLPPSWLINMISSFLSSSEGHDNVNMRVTFGGSTSMVILLTVASLGSRHPTTSCISLFGNSTKQIKHSYCLFQ